MKRAIYIGKRTDYIGLTGTYDNNHSEFIPDDTDITPFITYPTFIYFPHDTNEEFNAYEANKPYLTFDE